MKSNRGFTLIETLLTVAILGMIVGFGMPVLESYQTRNDVDIAVTTFVHNLRRAQAAAQAVDGDSAWGVSIATGTITVFRGSSFATRDGAFDEVTTISNATAVSGISEVVFAVVTGIPQTTGTTTLTTSANEVRTININAYGRINF